MTVPTHPLAHHPLSFFIDLNTWGWTRIFGSETDVLSPTLSLSLSLSFLLPHSPPAHSHPSSGACETMDRIAIGGPAYKCHFARHLVPATPVALVSLPSSPFLLAHHITLPRRQLEVCLPLGDTPRTLSLSLSPRSRCSTSLYSSQVWRPVARGPPPLHSSSRGAPEHPRSVSRHSLMTPAVIHASAPPLPLLPVSRLSLIAPAAIASV